VGPGEDGTTIVVTTPSGEPFTQALARELATRARLVFACGRYEGIDQRVLDEARGRAEVREVSIGDYVLNGGEVAALAITEAVVRLVPGFMGNPESLTEESHEDGLLEYPVYTKPATWRGREVPPVLLSGDHAAIRAWRHDQAVRRTAERRPDLAHPARSVQVADLAGEVALLRPADLGELQTLQWASFDPTQRETAGELAEDLEGATAWVLRLGGRLVGAVAARLEGEEWHLFLLMVAPDLRGRGLGRFLLEHAERAAPDAATSYSLRTGSVNAAQKLYKRLGYRSRGETAPGVVRLTKARR
jgi:tRNA (guanine37-N1)-methyltransferase